MPASATVYLILLKGKAHLCARVSETRVLNVCLWGAKLTFVSLARGISVVVYPAYDDMCAAWAPTQQGSHEFNQVDGTNSQRTR